MGTRASIAFIDYDNTSDKYLLYISKQFNGDMGPDMENGEKLIEYFNEIYLDKRNHDPNRWKMERIVKKLTADFGYDRDVSFKCIALDKSEDGKTWLDLQTTYLNKEKKEIDYKNDIWSSWFDYSDYLYIVPLCEVADVIVIEEDDEGISYNCYLEKDNMDVFCFREHVGRVDSKYGEFTENFRKDEMKIENKPPFAAPPLNTNVLPQKRFVEILTQYKDGDRYCLVVRDSDNKHVIFKEMR